MKRYKIYSLNDPITDEIRYIGQTCQTLQNRLNKHINSCSREICHRTNWINSLIKNDLVPKIVLIKDNLEKEECNDLEKHYIKFYRDNNFRLTNSTDGGDGSVGFKHSEVSKQKISKSRKIIMTIEYKNHLKDCGAKIWNSKTAEERMNAILVQKSRKDIYQYDANGNLIKIFPSLRQIERELGYLRQAISLCLCGKSKHSYGYIWRFE